MNCKQKIGTLVKDHMMQVIGYFVEASKNGAELDYNTQIEMVFKTLSKDFVGLRLHITFESKGEANLAIAGSSDSVGNKKKKQKTKKKATSTSVLRPVVGHFKNTCKEFLAAKGKEGNDLL
ncbi:hypothetical protein TIFTF001_027726 [Ficus carica]|uniref:Uncharacterized protein n=1 Tax=Ficus carica TaxID=3494 RepID=A0AA88IVI1_FICCA|nr:hypothetical protein TIFTF001_027726 [Ficus carica]